MAKKKALQPSQWALERAAESAKREIPDSAAEEESTRAEEQRGIEKSRGELAATYAPRIAEMEERLKPPVAGKYEVTAAFAGQNKIFGKFKAGKIMKGERAKMIKLSSAQAAEFAGPHQPFTLSPIEKGA